jgi:uncharacterized RDD family membrane protein YckC
MTCIVLNAARVTKLILKSALIVINKKLKPPRFRIISVIIAIVPIFGSSNLNKPILPSVLLIVFAKAIGVIICIILGWAYYALLESSSLQGTIGKFALKLEVTDLEGQPLDLLQATKRYFAHYLSILTLGAGFIILAFNDKKQAVHDLLTDCMVLDAVQQNKNNNGHILEKNY